MKKSLIALAVLASTGAALAQSNVTIYGRLDASVGADKVNGASTTQLFSGLLTTLIGAQLLWQLEHPWVPGFIGRKTFKRAHVINFQRRFDRWLGFVEKLCKPRFEYAFDHAWARAFSGLLLIVLGVLLALPIPFTNYPFGLIVLAFSLGFIERDGLLLGIGWILGLVEIVLLAEFSGLIIGYLADLLRYFG